MFDHQIYRENADYRLLPHLPILVQLNGINFRALTSHLPRPYSADLYELLGRAMYHQISEMQGAVTGYLQTDEITFVLRNDQTLGSEPWYNNRIQDIVSTTAAKFSNLAYQIYLTDYTHLELTQPLVFDCHAWTVPTLDKASEYLKLRQCYTYHWALDRVLSQHLQDSGEFSYSLIANLTLPKKKEILMEKFGIDLEAKYPSVFYRGMGVYRIPKWYLDQELPSFIDDPSFLLGDQS